MPTTAAVLAGFAGLLTGALAVIAVRYSERQQRQLPEAAQAPAIPAGVADVLAVLRSSAIVVDSADEVINISPSAAAYGLVKGTRAGRTPSCATSPARCAATGSSASPSSSWPGARWAGPVDHARAGGAAGQQPRAAAASRTTPRPAGVEEVRRDFVANVSHELKTPVGGLGLLAEAILDAKDDPEAVERFAGRMQVESHRLAQLVKEIVDLSRLQVADTLHEPRLVDVTAAVHEAIDYSRVGADAKQIEIAEACAPDLKVFGDEDLLVTAVRNLVGNAVAYSDPGTRVAVGGRRSGDMVEITVTDQGHGIPEAEQARIFERFYRVDAARSRATGGTGLGLAIVKHICANHGGDVSVWSEEGRGSTFTIRLPAAADRCHASGAATRTSLSTDHTRRAQA